MQFLRVSCESVTPSGSWPKLGTPLYVCDNIEIFIYIIYVVKRILMDRDKSLCPLAGFGTTWLGYLFRF
jgi:hypothetical protein